MGLDFSHCDAHWSYLGFHRFRRRIAKAIGVDLDEMSIFGSEGKPWSGVDSPLVALLIRSDCEGELSPSQCALMIEPLKKILFQWSRDDYDRQQGLQLVKGMESAVASNQHLHFH